MTVSMSPLAHADVRAVMDRALSNGRGVKIACVDIGEANSLRQRIYTMRKIDREANTKTYPEDDPRFGRSPYDALVVYPALDADDSTCLVIEVSTAERLNERVEDL